MNGMLDLLRQARLERLAQLRQARLERLAQVRQARHRRALGQAADLVALIGVMAALLFFAIALTHLLGD